MFDQAQAVRDALVLIRFQQRLRMMVAAAQGAFADVVDEALAATDMDTSLFVPIAVEEIREGTVRTEVIENRDDAQAGRLLMGTASKMLRLI